MTNKDLMTALETPRLLRRARAIIEDPKKLMRGRTWAEDADGNRCSALSADAVRFSPEGAVMQASLKGGNYSVALGYVHDVSRKLYGIGDLEQIADDENYSDDDLLRVIDQAIAETTESAITRCRRWMEL